MGIHYSTKLGGRNMGIHYSTKFYVYSEQLIIKSYKEKREVQSQG